MLAKFVLCDGQVAVRQAISNVERSPAAVVIRLDFPFHSKKSLKTRVAMVREKYLENVIFFRSVKSQGILWMAREIKKELGKSGKSQGI